MDYGELFKVAVFSAAGILAAILFCLYFFRITDTLSYRLVAVFLSLIFLSNLISKLLVRYFENKK